MNITELGRLAEDRKREDAKMVKEVLEGLIIESYSIHRVEVLISKANNYINMATSKGSQCGVRANKIVIKAAQAHLDNLKGTLTLV